LAGRSGYQIPLGIDRSLFLKLAASDWIADRDVCCVRHAVGQ
jgi:hypothetical protein